MARLAQLGLTLPSDFKPVGSYRAAVRSGNVLHIAGQGPMRDGKSIVTGKLGAAVSLEQGKLAARECALNCLAIIENTVGLSAVKQCVRATVYVACTPDFTHHPQVANGATDLLRELWGEAGLPARAAVGVPSLPIDIPVELELVVELKQ